MKWFQGRLRPLRQKLARGQLAPVDGLAPIVGKELASRWIGLLCRAVIGSAASPRDDRKLRSTDEIDEFGESGTRVYGARFTARVRVDAVPLRPDMHREVVGPVLLLLAILDQIRPGSRRAWDRALWLGPACMPAKPPPCLAARLGVSVRTVERWLATLRTIGVLDNWQPPASEANERQRNKNGRTYSLYEVREMSPEWAAWQAAGVKAEASRSRTAQHDRAPERNEGPRKASCTDRSQALRALALAAMDAAPS
jgi:hypothetical protein